LGETLVPDAHMMYGLADVRGLDFPTRWYAAYLDAAGRLPWIAYGTLVGPGDSPRLRALNRQYIVTTDEHGRVTLAELAHVQPRSFVVHEAVVAESEAHALELLRSAPDAVYSRVVISGPADVPPVVGDGDGEATPIAYAPTETAWNVVTGAGGYLVNTDAYYPGWRAYVDDRPAALYRANVAFRAVLVPAGRHTVTFRYEPRSMRMGVAVSVLAACVCVFLTWRHPPPRNGRPAASGAPAVPAAAELPGDGVRRRAPGPHAALVDAAQVVPGADGDAVVARVAAAAGAEEEVVIVEVPARRARRDRAAPAVAREDGIPVAGLRAPLLVHVVEEALEAPPGRLGGQGEAGDGAAEEDGDGDGGVKRDVGVDRVRTHLPLGPHEPGADGRETGRLSARVAHGEHPLDLVDEAAEGDGLRARDPGRRAPGVRDGQEAQGPQP